jgi:hypothetical protein
MGKSERVLGTYHPSPQKALERPQRPSLEQQAPQVGVHTQPCGVPFPQVPSSVRMPVCHAGGASAVVLWAAAPERRSSAQAASVQVCMLSIREAVAGLGKKRAPWMSRQVLLLGSLVEYICPSRCGLVYGGVMLARGPEYSPWTVVPLQLAPAVRICRSGRMS